MKLDPGMVRRASQQLVLWSWPDGSASHSYLKARGNITVGLSVEWSATFTVQGTTYPVVGTTTASTVSPVFETREAEAVFTG